MHCDSRFWHGKRGTKDNVEGVRRHKVALLILWKDVHSIGTFLVTPTENSELQSISPPSLRSSQLSYRNSSHQLLTASQIRSLTSVDSRAPRIKATWRIIIFFCINMEAVALDRLLNLLGYHIIL